MKREAAFVDVDGVVPSRPDDVEGCFGWVNGTLYLGEIHHAKIIAGLIDSGSFTWDTMISAKQMWGWFQIEGRYNWEEDAYQYQPKEPFLGGVWFRTDDAKQTYGIKGQVKNSFKEAFPWVNSWTFQKGLGYTTQTDYGQRAREQYGVGEENKSY